MEEVEKLLKKFGITFDKEARKFIDLIVEKITNGTETVKAVEEAIKESSFHNNMKAEMIATILLCSAIGYNSEIGIDEETLLKSDWFGTGYTLEEKLNSLGLGIKAEIVQSIQSGILLVNSVLDLVKKKSITIAQVEKAILNLNYLTVDETTDETVDEAKSYLLELRKQLNGVVEETDINLLPPVVFELLKMIDNIMKALVLSAISISVFNVVAKTIRNFYIRLINTEASRAWYEGFIKTQVQNKDVFGVKWKLSPVHYQYPYDICDVNASANIGYGAGIYPKNKVPRFPAHPHCMCRLEVVKNAKGKYNKEGVNKYIDKLDNSKLTKIFNKDNLKVYKETGDWEKTIRGWTGYENLNKI